MKKLFIFALAMLWSIPMVWAQHLELFGLPGMHVTALAISPKDYSVTWKAHLFAGTDSLGAFVRDLSQPDSKWSFAGLRGKKITALYLYHTGAGPGEFNWPLAGVEPNRTLGDSTILYGLIDSLQWGAFDSGMDRSLPSITAIAGIFYHGHEPPQPLFAGGHGKIYRSSSSGVNWEKVFEGDAPLNTLEVHQRSGEVWAGGGPMGYAFAPWIVNSNDRGMTWEGASLNYANNAVLSLAIHPRNADTVYAGLHGAVIKTTDGGNTWNETSLRDPMTSFYGLAIDPVNPEHIYAGGDVGRDPVPRFFTLYESLDGGVTWYKVPAPVMPQMRSFGLSGISSLIVDPIEGGVLYIATRGDGVWRYLARTRSPKTIRVPEDYATIQAGLDAAEHGDTLLVGPGTYVENIDFHGKNVLLKSRQGPEKTIIDGNRAGSVVTFAGGENPHARLDGFTLRRGSGTVTKNGVYGGGIYCSSSSPTIARNVIVENNVVSDCASFGGGIAVIGEAFPIIKGNRLKDNSVASICGALVNFGGGVFISNKSAPQLRENTITHNRADYGGGIAILDSAQPAIESNTITQNQRGGLFIANTALPRLGGFPNMGNDIVENLGVDFGQQLLRGGDGETVNALYNYFGVCPPTEKEVSPLGEFDTADCSKFSIRNYFPLGMGNRWTFGTFAPFTESIIDTVRIAGQLFFRFDQFRSQSEILLRLREDNKLTWRFDPMSVLEHVWVDFDAQVGDRWELVLPPGWTVELQSTSDTVTVPAGTFTNCYRFYFHFDGVNNDWVEWYAPGLGPVKRVFYGLLPPIQYLLASAVIHDLPVDIHQPSVDQMPEKFALHVNYPNPFVASTVMRYDLPQPAFVTLEIYNLLGQKVRTLLAEWKAAGQHRLAWDGRDDNGTALPSGIYFCKVVITSSEGKGPLQQIRKMVLLR